MSGTSGLVIAMGLIAACLTTGSWVPQAMKTIRTRSAGDFAWSYLLMFGGGVFLWMLYGVARRDPAIFGCNLITLLFIVGIAWVKWRP